MKRVTTYAEWLWVDGEYRLIAEEGYDYDGPWSLAMDSDFVSWDTDHFQWFNDDAATFADMTSAASEDSALTSPTLDTPYHLRIQVTNTDTGSEGNLQARLQFDVDGGGYTTLTTSSSNVKAVSAGDAGYPADDDEITTQLLASSPTTSNGFNFNDKGGHYIEDGTGPNKGCKQDSFQEYQFCVEFIDADLSGGETITFRLVNSLYSDDVPDNINFSPTATIAGGGGGTYNPVPAITQNYRNMN